MSTTATTSSTSRTSRRTVVAVILGAVVLTAVFLALAIAVTRESTPLLTLDTAVEPATHRVVVADPALLGIARAVTSLGSPLAMNLLTVIATAALLLTRRVRAAIYLAAARLVELGIETASKALVDRPRPLWADPVAFGSSSSFPSGHSAGTAVVVVALLLLGSLTVGRPATTVGRVGVGAGVVVGVLLLTAVPASRVLLGVHYPSDVTAGVALGAAVALALLPLLLLSNSQADHATPSPPPPIVGGT